MMLNHGADVFEDSTGAFKAHVKYTYYITQKGNDVISLAMDYSTPGADGKFLKKFHTALSASLV